MNLFNSADFGREDYERRLRRQPKARTVGVPGPWGGGIALLIGCGVSLAREASAKDLRYVNLANSLLHKLRREIRKNEV